MCPPGIKFERCDLCDNTVRLCFDGAEDVTFDFTNKTIKGDIWHHKGDEPITPIFSPTNLDIVLGRFEENRKPACGLKFRDEGGRVRLYRPRASFLTDCFTGERHFVDEKGKDLYFEPHETKYFIVEEK